MSETGMLVFLTGGSGFIGTNLIELLISKGYQVINFDCTHPIKASHKSYWCEGSVMDVDGLQTELKKTSPDIVIHLAAKTDTDSDELKDYSINYVGTKNLIHCIKNTISVKRFIIVSTQYVYKSDTIPFPPNDVTYKPLTTYGLSKAMMEKEIQESSLNCIWTIVRPTNVWGPWHMRYPNELWKVIDQGLYFHPSFRPIIRTYGYVGNVVHQIERICNSDESIINRRVFYVGDLPIDSYIWLDCLSMALRRRHVRRVPVLFFYLASIIGDFLRGFNIKFPLYSSRLNNMITDYYSPTYMSVKLFGTYCDDLNSNVIETVNWLTVESANKFNYWKGKGNNVTSI